MHLLQGARTNGRRRARRPFSLPTYRGTPRLLFARYLEQGSDFIYTRLVVLVHLTSGMSHAVADEAAWKRWMGAKRRYLGSGMFGGVAEILAEGETNDGKPKDVSDGAYSPYAISHAR